jgi:hypothetical protein
MIPRFSKILALLSCLTSVSLADDFKTASGKEYKNVTVSRQEPDGIIIASPKTGVMVKLYFTELPKEVQERFGFNPEKAAAYEAEQNAAFEQARREKGSALQQKPEAAQQQSSPNGFLTGAGNSSARYNRGRGGVHVNGYYRKDGTYVHAYDRAAAGSASHLSSAPSFRVPTTSSSVARDADGRIKRSESAKREFMRMTGYPNGRPGYVVDHIIPLKRGGCDCSANMQWQTIEQAKAKDRRE